MKRNAKTLALIVLAAVAIVGAWAVSRLPAADTPKVLPTATKFEYSLLRVDAAGNPTVYESVTLTTLTPPDPNLSTGLSPQREEVPPYVLHIEPRRDNALFAMNLMGRNGWEAVNITSQGDGYVVLLKRPVVY